MRSQSEHRRSALRRLPSLLALTALIAGVLPVAAAAAAPARETSRISSTPAVTWSPVGTVNPQYPWSANVQMQVYGAYLYTATSVVFNQHAIPVTVQQTILPFVRVPDVNAHTYKLVFHLRTDSTTTSRYQLDNRTPVDAAPGDTILEFTDTVHLDHVSMWSWTLGNVSGDNWVFYSCDIYEQTP
jgi:hypothetical protein